MLKKVIYAGLQSDVMSYHHYYSTYNSSPGLGYQCGICGRFARAQQRVPQCGVCMIPLCNTCNRFGFCPSHFEILSLQDKEIARENTQKMKKSMYIMFGTIFGGIVIFMIMPFSIINGVHSFSGFPNIFIGIFGSMFAFLGLVLGGTIYSQVTLRKTSEKLREIGMKYQAGHEPILQNPPAMPNFNPTPTFNGPQTYFPAQPTFPSKPVSHAPKPTASSQIIPDADSTPVTPAVKFCPFCGNTLSPNAQFCGNCGSAIK